MPLIKCLHDAKVDAKTIEELAAKSKKLQDENNLSEIEADRKVKNEFIVDEHNKLSGELHEVKKEIGLVRKNAKPPKPITYSEPDLTEINKRYDEAKNNIPSEKTEPIVEETKAEVPPEEKIIEEPTGGEPPKEPPPLPETNDGKNVGVSHASLTELAQKLGFKEPERGEFLPPEWYAERGRKLLKAGADPNEVNNPNNELHDRIAIARAQLENLVKSADEVGKEKGFDSDEYRDELKSVDDYANNVVKKLGTLAHRAFESLQGNRDLDTDSFTEVKRSFTDATGDKPSKEQEAKIKELTEKNQKLKQQADELEKKLVEATNASVGKKTEKATAKKSHEQYVKERNDSFQAARDALKKLRTGESGLGASIPLARELAAVAPHMAKIVKSLLEEGVDKLGDLVDYIHDELSKDMVGLRRRDVIDLVSGEYIKQEDKAAEINQYADIKKQAKLVKKLEDLQNGLPEDFDSNKVEQTPEVKKLLEQIKKVKKDLAAIGYMQKKISQPLSAEEKNINRLQKELDDLQRGKARQSSPSRVLSEREKELQEQIKDEREKLGLVSSKGEKPLTEEEQKAADEKELVALQEQFVDKKDSRFTLDEAKSIWDYAKKNYLDKGISYKEMIQQVSQDLGLSWRQVSDAVTTPKVRPISDAMWKKQSDYRRSQLATKNWIEEQDKNPFTKALKKVSGVFRGVAVYGHGGIFMGTHAGMTLFQPSTWNKTIPAFFRGWKYAYFQKHGAYAREMEAFKHRDNYVLAQRAGLKNNPDRLSGEEYQKSQKYLGSTLGGAGERGFNAVKVLRQDLFDYHYNKLSDAEKADPNAVKNIAKLVNNATGATNLNIPEWVNEVSFAGGMEAARWGKLTRNPVKAGVIALKSIYNPSKVAVGEKVFAKVWARRVGEQLATITGLLLANAAIQKQVNPKNPTNLTDPNKPDYMKFKFGDLTLDPTSGMRGVGMFIYGLGKIPFEDQKQLKGDTRMQALGKQGAGYGRGKLAPLYSTLADFYTGQDFNRNPLPYSDDKPTAGHHKLTWTEYAWQKAPLPVAEAANVTYQSAVEHGADKKVLNDYLWGVVSGAISGSTGFRVGEFKDKPTPFNEEDKKDPTFKFYLDKGLELPNTSLSSEHITNVEKSTDLRISEYPQKVQDDYTKEHKAQLKTILQAITNDGKGQVFVTYLKGKDGKAEPHVSITSPSAMNYKVKKISELTKDELTQVLSIAQKKATTNAKAIIFSQLPEEEQSTEEK